MRNTVDYPVCSFLFAERTFGRNLVPVHHQLPFVAYLVQTGTGALVLYSLHPLTVLTARLVAPPTESSYIVVVL